MIWGVRSDSAFYLLSIQADLVEVDRMWYIPFDHRTCSGWAWLGGSNIWRFILLDIYVFIYPLALSSLLDCWLYAFSQRSSVALTDFLIEDSNTVGNIASVASVEWGCALQIMAAASIGSGLQFTATTAQTL